MSSPERFLLQIVIVLFLTLGTIGAEDDYVPINTQAEGEEPPSPEEAASLITVPEGFQVRLFAGDPDVRQPVAMALDERGRLFVAESYSYKEWEKRGEDRILIFEDTDNDGRHDSRKIFTTGIDHLSGMTVGWGGVWVCSAPHLLFYPDANHDDIPDSEPEIVLDGWTTDAKHNFFNGLEWGPDGWLYGRHGITRPSDVGKPGASDGDRVMFDCAIWKYHPLLKKFEVVCRGTTNPWGLDWNEKGDMFFTNNVNGHLWHAIPGAFYPRMGERADPCANFVYDRIQMCCDHLHHAGAHTDWTKTRDGKGVHGQLGGGHSHSGGMIYQGGKWPDKYNGKIFMCNTHGRRVNVDRLDPAGVTYVGRHEDDFLHANNEWFRGVQLLYGPDGDVFVSDWVDNGECHDNDGVHRTSGRIYKIIYGDPSPPVNQSLTDMSHKELVALHTHRNQWYVRTARRLLLERAKNPSTHPSMENALEEAQDSKPFQQSADFLATLRAFREIRGLDVHDTIKPLGNNDSDDKINIFPQSYDGILRLAGNLPRYESDLKIPLAISILRSFNSKGFLVRDGIDSRSQRIIELITYYGIKDEIAQRPDDARSMLTASAKHRTATFAKNLSQNLAENRVFEPIIDSLAAAPNPMITAALLDGLSAGLKGARNIPVPEGWPSVFQRLYQNRSLRAKVLSVNLVFDQPSSLTYLEKLLHGSPNLDEPDIALDLLINHPIPSLAKDILPLVEEPGLSMKAIEAIGKYRDAKLAEKLIASHSSLAADSKLRVIDILSGNRNYATALIDAIEAGRISRKAVTAYHAREIQNYRDKALNSRLAKVWGKTGSSSNEKREQIKYWRDQLLPDVLAKGDLENGQVLYQALCSSCHSLHGSGGVLGPELTGANRSDLYYLLENIIDPSATLPADFQINLLTTEDGNLLSGNIASENEYSVTLKNLAGEQTLSRDEITKRETLPQSLMPEGLLNNLSPDQVRDLIAYLQK